MKNHSIHVGWWLNTKGSNHQLTVQVTGECRYSKQTQYERHSEVIVLYSIEHVIADHIHWYISSERKSAQWPLCWRWTMLITTVQYMSDRLSMSFNTSSLSDLL